MSKDRWGVFGLGFVLTAVGFVVAFQFVEPAPPRDIRMASGGSSGAYYAFATLYKERLAREGINVEVLETAGSIANLGLLTDASAPVDVAFVQGGVGGDFKDRKLESLGSLYFEPLWIFYRPALGLTAGRHLSQFKSRRIAIGGPGSGTRAVAAMVLADNGIDETNATLEPVGGDKAAARLENGEVDAMAMVAGPNSPLVRRLLANPELALFDFGRAEAYVRRHRFLSKVVLPEGVIDFAANIPPRDITLLAPAASLVAAPHLHPALGSLLLATADAIHRQGSVFESDGAFPSARFVEFPLRDEAARFLRAGPPFLQRYLGFWAADLIDRLKVMLLPLLTLLIPLVKILPPTYRWRIQSRIYRWYKDLRAIEAQIMAAHTDDERVQLTARINQMDKEVCDIQVPISYVSAVYDLRLHINLVRNSLTRR